MPRPLEHADPTLLVAFAAKAAALPPEAWDRIGARCALLDSPTVAALLARVELFARSITPDSDPYSRPLVRSTMAMLGGMFGMLHEVSARLAPPDPQAFDRAMQQRHDQESAGRHVPGLDAALRIESLAQHVQADHPGTAAALRAVSLALMARRTSPPAVFDAIYRPFEPEIPFASLSPGEHAAQHGVGADGPVSPAGARTAGPVVDS